MANAPRVIVSVTNDLYTDQRVNKVCTFLHVQGYDVTLVGRKRRSSLEIPERIYRTKRIRLLFEKGPMFYAFYNIRLFFFLLFHRADILVANDLDTLLANYLVSKLKGSRLVYDTHEYFTEVPELINRPRVQNIWLRIEKWIFPKLETVYTVNQSIAEIYSKKYRKDLKVVRNISPIWKPDKILSKEELGIPENKNLIILQGAGINIDRGAEEAVEAMKDIDAVLMIVGDGDVIPQLKQRVKECNLGEKVIFYGKKPYDIMMNYTYYADIGLTLDKATNMNYKFSLPNKVFDYLHTYTAIIATDIIEVTRIINTHNIGVVLNELTVESLSQALRALFSDRERLELYKLNCSKAAIEESWEHETKILESIYPKIG